MSNRTALILFLAIVASFGLLFATVDGAALFLARRFSDLINWVAFWR